MAAGIEAAQPGNRLGDVSCAVGDVAREYGYPINLEFGGHGVGHIMHGDPHVPNDGKAHHGYKLRPGLVIAIEPWFLKTTDEIYQDPKDGWTLKSEDGSRGAHSEHTIAITENGPVILTSATSPKPYENGLVRLRTARFFMPRFETEPTYRNAHAI